MSEETKESSGKLSVVAYEGSTGGDMQSLMFLGTRSNFFDIIDCASDFISNDNDRLIGAVISAANESPDAQKRLNGVVLTRAKIKMLENWVNQDNLAEPDLYRPIVAQLRKNREDAADDIAATLREWAQRIKPLLEELQGRANAFQKNLDCIIAAGGNVSKLPPAPTMTVAPVAKKPEERVP